MTPAVLATVAGATNSSAGSSGVRVKYTDGRPATIAAPSTPTIGDVNRLAVRHGHDPDVLLFEIRAVRSDRDRLAVGREDRCARPRTRRA